MSVVTWEKEGTVAVVKMTNGENRMDLTFAREMLAALDAARADESVTAIVITSTDEKFFSNGIDVAWLGEQHQQGNISVIKDFLYGMDEVFKRLLTIEVPVIAAINGHAFGNGAIMSCACDFRFMKSDRGFFCFPEVDVGIPFLPGMLAFCRDKAVPRPLFNRMALTGIRLSAQELEAHQVIEKACADAADLMETVMEFARGLIKRRGVFGEQKRRMHKGIVEIIDTEDPPLFEAMQLMA